MCASRWLALALTSAALLSPARARGYDPALRWYSVDTEHFVVNYHEGLAELAQRAARALEAAHQRLVPLLGHAPRERVQVVVSDASDDANGSATAYLRPTMELFAPPPDDRSELNDYEDYLWNLVVHEYTHIVHLDQVGGVPAVVNSVFGKLWMPNGLQPRWLIEGLAVWSESAHSGSGRERSAIYDMYLRSEALEDRFFALDEVTGAPTRWPQGAVAYLHGARFMAFISERYGAQGFSGLSKRYGSQLIPFGLNAAARAQFGRDYRSLYGEWEASVRAQVEAQVAPLRRQGLTPFVRLTRAGQWTGEPAFDPRGGRVVYLEASADRRAAIRSVERDGASDRRVAEIYGSGGLALEPDGRHAVVSQNAPYREFYSFDDLFRVDLSTGTRARLTFGARLTDPDVSPDGSLVVAARHFPGGRMGIDELPIRGHGPRALVGVQDRAVYTPRYSPDGKRVAFSEQTGAGRQIFLVNRQTLEREQVTRERAMNLDPTFDPTGRWLVWASDKTGIYNLYARELLTGETRQLTNVTTGAFRPRVSPDGRSLAFVTYTTDGYDVALMPFEAERATLAEPLEQQRPPLPDWDRREPYAVRSYHPLDTLWPRYWLPLLASDPMGTTVGVVTGGFDVAGRHTWDLQVLYGLSSHRPSVGLGWTARVIYPELTAAFTSDLSMQRSRLERESALSLGASLPFSGVDWASSVFLGYELRYYAPDSAPVPQLQLGDDLPPPRRGVAATAIIQASFSDTLRFQNSISAERGGSFSVQLRAARPEIGSQFTSYAAQAATARFFAMPWLSHHVLALRLGGGVADGDLGGRSAFALGGIGFRDPVLDLLNQTGVPGAALRGYPVGAFRGNRYFLGNAEYRVPIAAVDRGLWTLPIFLRRIHAAATFDYGLAADHLKLSELRPAVGAELRAEVLLGYGLLTNLRLGFARGLGPGWVNEVFLGLGSGF